MINKPANYREYVIEKSEMLPDVEKIYEDIKKNKQTIEKKNGVKEILKEFDENFSGKVDDIVEMINNIKIYGDNIFFALNS